MSGPTLTEGLPLGALADGASIRGPIPAVGGMEFLQGQFVEIGPHDPRALRAVTIDGVRVGYIDLRIGSLRVEIEMEHRPNSPIRFDTGLPEINGKILTVAGIRWDADASRRDHSRVTLSFWPDNVKEANLP